MTAETKVLSRGLPKTGQLTYVEDGDDEYYQAGWWRGRKVANNKTRFIIKTLNGDDVVIDRATGLMWPVNGGGLGCMMGGTANLPDAILFAEGLDFAGFTDWRLPNINELLSIVYYNNISPSIKEPPFANTRANYYWSSTTYYYNILQTWTVEFTDGESLILPKTDLYYLRCVRGGL